MIGMKVEDLLDGDTNFIYWKSIVLLILEENDLFKFVNEKVPEPEAGGRSKLKQEGFWWT